MYINFKLLISNHISASELLILQGIKQKDYDLFIKSEHNLDLLLKRGYLTMIKGVKTQPLYTKYRLSKKGKTFLRDLGVADLTNSVKQLASNLIDIYITNGLKAKLGNKKKVVELLSWFVNETQFDNILISEVVSDYVNSTEFKYTSKLDNLIWIGDNVFSTKWNLSQSKLYKLIKT